MGIIEDFAGVDLQALFDELDEIFSEPGERRRFMASCSTLDAGDLGILQSILGGQLSIDEMPEASSSTKQPVQLLESLFNLTTELEETKNLVLLAFVFKLLEMPGVFDQVDTDGQSLWIAFLAANPALTGDQLQFIWSERKKACLADEEGSYLLEVIADNPEAPASVLEDLLDYDDRSVQSAIARNKNVTPAIIHKYLNSPRKPDRKALAGNQHVDAEVLMSLMADKYEDIVKSAKRNYTKRFSAADLTEEAIAAAVAKHIEKPYVAPKEPKKAFDPHDAESRGLDYVVKLSVAGQRKKVAENTRDPELLEALARDRSAVVRRVVAGNWKCPAEMLGELIHDKDLQTSNIAFLCLLNSNESLTAEDVLSEEELSEARASINHFLANHFDDLNYETKLNARDTAALERALLLARFTRNEMLQRQIMKSMHDDTSRFTIGGRIRDALSENRRRCNSVIRTLIFEHEFGVWRQIEECRDTALLDELIADERLDGQSIKIAVRTRDKLLAEKV